MLIYAYKNIDDLPDLAFNDQRKVLLVLDFNMITLFQP